MYRPGGGGAWSYRPDEGCGCFRKMRYLDLAVIRIRPGHGKADLAKLLRLRSFSLDSINLDRPEIVYQIISGAPGGNLVGLCTDDIAGARASITGGRSRRVYAEGAEENAKKIAVGMETRAGRVYGFGLSPGPVMYRMNSRLKMRTSGVQSRALSGSHDLDQ